MNSNTDWEKYSEKRRIYNHNLYLRSKIKCPKCGSSHYNKWGFHFRKNKKVQRARCQNCGHLFFLE